MCRYIRITLFLLGLVATMPVLGIVFQGHFISAYIIITFLVIVGYLLQCIKSGKLYLKNNKITTLLISWLFVMIIASFFGMLYYCSKPTWTNTIANYIPKIIIYLAIILVLSSNEQYCKDVFRGLLVGFILNLILSLLDAGVFYVFHFSITNRLFQNYIRVRNVRYGTLSLISNNGFIRSAGFSEDPAQIGMIAPIVFGYGLYKKKYSLVTLAFLSLLSSMSTTAMIGIIIELVVLLNMKKTHKTSRAFVKLKTLIIGTIFLIGMAALLYFLKDIIGNTISSFVSRIHNVYINSGFDNARIKYLKYFPIALFNQNLKILTGTGFMSASAGYLGIEGIDSLLLYDKPFDMENTYLAYFFDGGVIGIILYILVLYKILKREKEALYENGDRFHTVGFTSMLSLISCGFFYHYTLFSVQMLILIALTCSYNNEQVEEIT